MRLELPLVMIITNAEVGKKNELPTRFMHWRLSCRLAESDKHMIRLSNVLWRCSHIETQQFSAKCLKVLIV